MKRNLIGVGVAHLGNFLSLFDQLIFLDQEHLVVSVGAEVGLVVFQNDQIAIAPESRACVNHFPICRGKHRLARFVGDVDAFVLAFIE